ncbi:MAG: hypothetical protein J5840_09095 [Lachnospiraceae bacterium]|nr:hypothetical protein [Lachnospiraceae bacterium]
MDKQERKFFIFGIISLAVLAIIVGVVLSENHKYNESLCNICHKNKKIEGKNYCIACFAEAKERVNQRDPDKPVMTYYYPEKEKEADKPVMTYNYPYEKKKTEDSSDSGKSGSSNSGRSGKTSSYSKTSSSSNYKDYDDLEFDPVDYDDPDDYAEDAWGVDFEDYDDAYDYWEDY